MNRFFSMWRAVLPAIFLFTAGSARTQDKTARQEAVFCAYNVKNWLAMDRYDPEQKKVLIGEGKPASEKERVVSILKAIKPDVLGVCEIGTADDLADLQARLKQAGIDLPFTELAHGGDETRRLALLSRFPITARNSQTSLTYKLGEVEMPFQRGILDATVQFTNSLDVRFIGVHLKSKREVPEGDQNQMRRNEARLLRRHLDGIFSAAPGARILAYGDFNEHRNEPAIDTIIGDRRSETEMTDLWLKDIHGEVWTHFWDAADTYSRLDYLFTSRLLRPHLDLKRSFIYSARDFDKASDHRPIVTTIRFAPWQEKEKDK
ncbi:MAG: endonuclease/exonuclease/phosphatase family protein [Verrucomicrobiaceae bacterium]|nr:endonuclease/exonuclease/phosphatase family protein [Verrucomicrobiaceae bacterium]